MSALTDFAENKLIDFLFRNQQLGIGGSTNLAGISNLYVALFTVQPTDSSAGTEVVASAGPGGTAYARVAVGNSLANWAGTQAAASNTASSGTGGVTSNNNAVTFPAPGSTGWGSIVGWGIFDAATGGNLILQAALTGGAKTVNANDAAPSFAAGALTVTVG